MTLILRKTRDNERKPKEMWELLPNSPMTVEISMRTYEFFHLLVARGLEESMYATVSRRETTRHISRKTEKVM
jgi:hypothetical protein